MTGRIVEKIRNADMVLVGLGEELDALTKLKQELQYQVLAGELENSWILPFVEKIRIEEMHDRQKEVYSALSLCLEKKNYFIVSVCQDGLIHKADLDEKRIVEPCGGYGKLQCSRKCSTELYEVPSKVMKQVNLFLRNELPKEKLEEPVCPKCGRPLIFNRVNAPDYVEEGYLEKWAVYKKWLQGTVNKDVCLLEAGVGMKYPTVIRWPFEKIVFFNQKAELFRVHSRLYQISEEIKERSYGICQNPEDFFKELSNAF